MTTTTDPQGELLPIVNENDEAIGTISRGKAHKSHDTIHWTPTATEVIERFVVKKNLVSRSKT